MPIPIAFVNYDNPSQIKDRAKRQIVSSHIGKFYRNRSGPSSRKVYATQVPQVDDTEPEPCPSASTLDHANFEETQNVSTLQRSPRPAPRQRRSFDRGLRDRFLQWHHGPQPHLIAPLVDTPKQYYEYAFPELHNAPEWPRCEEETEHVQPEYEAQEHAWPTSPLSVLGQGRVDPFAQFAVEEDYTFIHADIDYGQFNLFVPV